MAAVVIEKAHSWRLAVFFLSLYISTMCIALLSASVRTVYDTRFLFLRLLGEFYTNPTRDFLCSPRYFFAPIPKLPVRTSYAQTQNTILALYLRKDTETAENRKQKEWQIVVGQ